MRLVISFFSLLSAMVMMAQQYRTLGDFTSDTDGTSIHNALMELTLTKDQDDYSILSLKIFHDKESNYALVDTLWRAESAYRTEGKVKTDTYEERGIFFLYTFDKTGRLDTYYVFSSFVDTTRDDFTQVVVRKFTADGKRVWCLTANATDARSKEFSQVLTDARKKLRFKKASSTKGDGRDKPEYWEPRVNRSATTIGRGSAYGSGW